MTYAGLCIGGPWNGRHVTCSESEVRVPMAPPDPTQRIEIAVAYVDLNAKPVHDFTYNHFQMACYSFEDAEPQDVHFWVNRSIPPDQRTTHVITVLMQDYGSI